MALNPRFFKLSAPLTSGQLTTLLKAEIIGATDVMITDLAEPAEAGTGILCYVSNQDSLNQVPDGAVVIVPAEIDLAPRNNGAAIRVENPRLAFALAVSSMLNKALPVDNRSGNPPQIDPTAQIAPSAIIEGDVCIGANVAIDACSVIKHGVQIGANSRVGANCTLSHCEIGEGCVVQDGAVIGGAGFGFEITGAGPVAIPHVGAVRLGRGVLVGSNCTIDRGSLGDTIIEDQVMIDNLVHIAHNCVIGARSVITGQVGIAGSTRLGKGVMIGGQAGIADHLEIGAGALIMARSGVTKDVDPKAKMVGFPAVEAGQYWREQAAIRKLLRQQKNKKED